jgi:hydroxymethylpyrimidine/phosphomethylpyrimidine kinase
VRVALAIAGSDSGGGAGIQADLAAFRNLGVWGTTAITCLTAQNPDRVTRVEAAAPDMVAEQIAVVCRRFPVAAIKIGMTYSAPVIEAISGALDEHAAGIPVVLDPVMRATSGAGLLQPGGDETLEAELLPRAMVVTPNLPEACVLAEMAAIDNVATMEEAARRIAAKGSDMVVITGGHLKSEALTDVVLWQDEISHLRGDRVQAPSTHGTGCSFSSALAATLALGMDPLAAARRAKDYVTAILEASVNLGDDDLHGLGFVEPGT